MSILLQWWRELPISETAKTYIEGVVVGIIGIVALQILFRVLAWVAVTTL